MPCCWEVVPARVQAEGISASCFGHVWVCGLQGRDSMPASGVRQASVAGKEITGNLRPANQVSVARKSHVWREGHLERGVPGGRDIGSERGWVSLERLQVSSFLLFFLFFLFLFLSSLSFPFLFFFLSLSLFLLERQQETERSLSTDSLFNGCSSHAWVESN